MKAAAAGILIAPFRWLAFCLILRFFASFWECQLKKSETCWADQYSAKPGPKHDANKHGTEQIKGGPTRARHWLAQPEFQAGSPNWARFCSFAS